MKKNIFDEPAKSEILGRIEKITPESKALWGKMNVSQMLAHSAMAAQFPTGEVVAKTSPLQFIGRFLKKAVIHSDKPFRKNSPTAAEITVVDPREFEKEKMNLIAAVKKLTSDTAKAETHPFFGKMTTEDWGIVNYKHTDHHLRQFGV